EEGGADLMGFVGGGMGGGSHVFLDPLGSVQVNPNSSISDFDHQSFLGNPVAVYKPEALQIDPRGGGAAATSGQSLSLSLSSHHQTSNLPLELNLHRYDSPIFAADNNNNNNKDCGGGGGRAYNNNLAAGSCSVSSSIELSKSSVPLGPFTGYASILKGSRFLKPAQQLLEELCDVSRGILLEINGASPPDSPLLDPSPPPLIFCSKLDESSADCSEASEHTRKKSRLLSMLDEVYKRYKQYYHQVQNAVAAFESVAGLSGAAPFANLALRAMSKHFRFLKNAIVDQLQFSAKSSKKRKESSSSSPQSLENASSRHAHHHHQHQHHGLGGGFGETPPPVWRPQRGLPEKAVSVLRAWLFEHFLHPYPTDTDKIMLATQTGLSRNQVSNWFINARVRLWKPMVEEIHMLETRQNQNPSQRNQDHQQLQQPGNQFNNAGAESSTSASLRRGRDDGSINIEASGGGGGMKPPYDVDRRLLQGIGVGGGGVSLTLGLHQNGVGMAESYGQPPPINAARRLGLEPHGGEGYVVAGDFPVGNRQFGQLMHDFVG
ncbi:hypothetical protein M569_03172, partial [Genlisea aurea]